MREQGKYRFITFLCEYINCIAATVAMAMALKMPLDKVQMLMHLLLHLRRTNSKMSSLVDSCDEAHRGQRQRRHENGGDSKDDDVDHNQAQK